MEAVEVQKDMDERVKKLNLNFIKPKRTFSKKFKRSVAPAFLVFLLVVSMFPLIGAQPTGVQTVIIRPNEDVVAAWSSTTSGSSGSIYAATIAYKDSLTTQAYISRPYSTYYTRYNLLSFDLSSIPTGALLTSITVYDAFTYTTIPTGVPMGVHASSAFGFSGAYNFITGVGAIDGTETDSTKYGYWFNNANVAFNITMGATVNTYYSASGSSSIWQTQFNTNRTIYVGFSTLYAGTGDASWGNDLDGGSYDAYITVSYSFHYQAVDETTAGGNGDTDYLYTNTINTYEHLGWSAVPVGCSGEIKSIVSVELWVIARLNGGGTVTVRAGFYIGSTYYAEISTTVPNTYTNLTSGAITTNPATSSAWTLSDVNGLVTRMYTQDNKELRVTQMGMIVTVNYGWASTFTSTPPTAPHSGYWWPNDAYSYTVTLNESASLTYDTKPSFLTWTSGNSTLWGRLSTTITTQTATVSFHATSTNGKVCSWQNYTFDIQNTQPTFTSSPPTSTSLTTSYTPDGAAYLLQSVGAMQYYYPYLNNLPASPTPPSTLTVTMWVWMKVNSSATGAPLSYFGSTVGADYASHSHTWSTPTTTMTNYSYSWPASTWSAATLIAGPMVMSVSMNTLNQPLLIYGMGAVVTGTSYSKVLIPNADWTTSGALGSGITPIPYRYWGNYYKNIIGGYSTTWGHGNYVYDSNATDPEGMTLAYGLTTNLGGDVAIDSGTGEVTKTAPHSIGTFYLHISASDGTANVSWQFYTVTIGNNLPVFTNTPPTTWSYKDDFSEDYNATDSDSDPITYALETDWEWSGNDVVTINTSTGVVSGTHFFTPGTYYLHVSASDGIGYAWKNTSITVTNSAVSFTSTPPTTWNYFVDLYYDANATDPESQTIYYDVSTDYPGGLTIDHGTGLIQETKPLTEGTYYVHISAATDNGNATIKQWTWQNFSLTISNELPYFTSTPPSGSWSYVLDFNYDANATDPEGQTLTFGLETDWSGLSIVPGTGVVSRTQPHTPGTYYIHVNVTDGFNIVWQNFSITVENLPPSFTSSPVTTCSWASDYSYDADATDSDDPTLTYGVESDMPGIGIVPLTGVISASHPHANTTYYVHVNVSDGTNLVWQNFTVTITNIAPAFTSSPTLSVVETYEYTYTMTGSDSEGAGLTFACTEKPSFLTFSSGNNTLWGTPAIGVAGVHSIKLTVYDGNKYAYQNYSLTVTAVWHPTFTSTPTTTGFSLLLYSYDANCNESVTFSVSGTITAWATIVSGTGVLSGTPTLLQYGPFSANILATNVRGATTWQNFTVTIAASLLFTSTPVTSVYEDFDYVYYVTTNGPVGSVVITMTGNATGFSYNATTHRVTGSSSTPGWVNVNLTATLDGLTAWQNYTITIKVPTDQMRGWNWIATSGILTVMGIFGFFGMVCFPALYFKYGRERGFQGFIWFIIGEMIFIGCLYVAIVSW